MILDIIKKNWAFWKIFKKEDFGFDIFEKVKFWGLFRLIALKTEIFVKIISMLFVYKGIVWYHFRYELWGWGGIQSPPPSPWGIQPFHKLLKRLWYSFFISIFLHLQKCRWLLGYRILCRSRFGIWIKSRMLSMIVNFLLVSVTPKTTFIF